MADFFISDKPESVTPADDDWLIVEDAANPGSYFKVRKSNIASTNFMGGITAGDLALEGNLDAIKQDQLYTPDVMPS